MTIWFILRGSRNLWKKIVFDKLIIFDVGSHQGKMTRLFRDLYNDARIYCFEPNVKIVKFLKKVDDNSSYLKIKNFISGKKKKVI